MKYSEFKKQVKKLGYDTVEDSTSISIEKYGDTVAKISKIIDMIVDNYNIHFAKLKKDERAEILKLTVELAKTPIKEREDKEDDLDLIICSLKEIQTDVEDVMNWVEEIKERSRNLRNALEDMIIYSEERKKTHSIED